MKGSTKCQPQDIFVTGGQPLCRGALVLAVRQCRSAAAVCISLPSLAPPPLPLPPILRAGQGAPGWAPLLHGSFPPATCFTQDSVYMSGPLSPRPHSLLPPSLSPHQGSFLKTGNWIYPGGPMVKTWRFLRAEGVGSIPGQELGLDAP